MTPVVGVAEQLQLQERLDRSCFCRQQAIILKFFQSHYEFVRLYFVIFSCMFVGQSRLSAPQPPFPASLASSVMSETLDYSPAVAHDFLLPAFLVVGVAV